MSYEQMLEFDKIATLHFEEKKRYDSLKAKLPKNDDSYKEKITEYKDKTKYHKQQFEHYDKLAYKEMDGLNISALYLDQVSKENTRALRSVRYFHYRKWKKASLKDKERWGIELVKESLKRSKTPVVSSSFGIDSIVTLYIVRKALTELGRDPSDIQIIWNDTLNEFPEVRMYAMQLKKDWNLNLLVTKPKMPLKKVIDKHGGIDSSYFTSRKGDRRGGRPLSEKCCGTLKHEPMKRAIKENDWDLVINGLRADESTQRLRAGLRDGEYFYSNTEWKAYTCRPIMWMTDEDVWDYVEQENIPYNSLYDKNMILEYPTNNEEVVDLHKEEIIKRGLDIEELSNKQVHNVGRKQAHYLRKIGYKVYTPRTGCMMCPIPIRYSYLQWMRTNYPKVFQAMIFNLGYGKGLLDLIPDDVKEEIEFVTGIDLNEENAHEHIKDILEAKPCVFDKI
jgi:3'-phosphoadenosine 5'-phosphosulfate sulfotransferase (PAPS reductase)/FAD synthetase